MTADSLPPTDRPLTWDEVFAGKILKICFPLLAGFLCVLTVMTWQEPMRFDGTVMFDRADYPFHYNWFKDFTVDYFYHTEKESSEAHYYRPLARWLLRVQWGLTRDGPFWGRVIESLFYVLLLIASYRLLRRHWAVPMAMALVLLVGTHTASMLWVHILANSNEVFPACLIVYGLLAWHRQRQWMAFSLWAMAGLFHEIFYFWGVFLLFYMQGWRSLKLWLYVAFIVACAAMKWHFIGSRETMLWWRLQQVQYWQGMFVNLIDCIRLLFCSWDVMYFRRGLAGPLQPWDVTWLFIAAAAVFAAFKQRQVKALIFFLVLWSLLSYWVYPDAISRWPRRYLADHILPHLYVVFLWCLLPAIKRRLLPLICFALTLINSYASALDVVRYQDNLAMVHFMLDAGVENSKLHYVAMDEALKRADPELAEQVLWRAWVRHEDAAPLYHRARKILRPDQVDALERAFRQRHSLRADALMQRPDLSTQDVNMSLLMAAHTSGLDLCYQRANNWARPGASDEDLDRAIQVMEAHYEQHAYLESRERPGIRAARRNLLGVLYRRRGLYEQAQQSFQEALELDAQHRGARLNLESIQSEIKTP